MHQLCRVYPPCYLCKRSLYSLALGSHIVKFLTISLTPLWELCIAECVLLSVCLAVLYCLAMARGLSLGWLGQLTKMSPEEKQNTYNRLLCAVPGVPDRWEARSILLLLDYSLLPYLLPIAHPCPTYYYTILLYYIVNTLTMYLSLCCIVCCSLCLLVARSLARSALSTVPCVSLSSLGWVFVNFLTISLHC